MLYLLHLYGTKKHLLFNSKCFKSLYRLDTEILKYTFHLSLALSVVVLLV